MLHIHTSGRSRVNPERQEEGKSGHRQRAKGQNSAGGEGDERTSRTNLRGETDLTKTEHTPKPHDTLRRSTGEELGTEWGLVGDGRETTQKNNLKRTQFQLQQVSCVTPLRDRSQVVPQWHKQLFKFQRIKCTKCLASPETIKKDKLPHLKVMCLPGIHVMLYFKSWSCSRKNKVSDCSDRHPAERWSIQGFAKDSRNGGTIQKAGKR